MTHWVLVRVKSETRDRREIVDDLRRSAVIDLDHESGGDGPLVSLELYPDSATPDGGTSEIPVVYFP